MYTDVNRLRDFVETKLETTKTSADFDELRENIFGRPCTWKVL